MRLGRAASSKDKAHSTNVAWKYAATHVVTLEQRGDTGHVHVRSRTPYNICESSVCSNPINRSTP